MPLITYMYSIASAADEERLPRPLAASDSATGLQVGSRGADERAAASADVFASTQVVIRARRRRRQDRLCRSYVRVTFLTSVAALDAIRLGAPGSPGAGQSGRRAIRAPGNPGAWHTGAHPDWVFNGKTTTVSSQPQSIARGGEEEPPLRLISKRDQATG
ncbi:hypothetical protein PG985_009892 [Apiospora marii]|uniref:uncharacterized protein n=1 Tax=Apiospora marii TaxID=335849 RepID=UPI0031328AA1